MRVTAPKSFHCINLFFSSLWDKIGGIWGLLSCSYWKVCHSGKKKLATNTGTLLINCYSQAGAYKYIAFLSKCYPF